MDFDVRNFLEKATIGGVAAPNFEISNLLAKWHWIPEELIQLLRAVDGFILTAFDSDFEERDSKPWLRILAASEICPMPNFLYGAGAGPIFGDMDVLAFAVDENGWALGITNGKQNAITVMDCTPEDYSTHGGSPIEGSVGTILSRFLSEGFFWLKTENRDHDTC